MADSAVSSWHRSLAKAVRDPDELLARLGLPAQLRVAAREAARQFPLVVPESYLQRICPGDVNDPLLRQVLPLSEELQPTAGFGRDPVGDSHVRTTPGVLQKYAGRALLIATGTCAIHCRYCFRRHYAYGDEPRTLAEWDPAWEALRADESLREVILSGGDPLVLTDRRLSELIERIADVPHVTRLRLHSRLPIVLPDRITDSLLSLLTGTRLAPVMVVHANHPNEIVGDCAKALGRLREAGVLTLNQTVLLRGINDDVATLVELSERLCDLGVVPYYLHQLDRVAGAAHFEVAEDIGVALVEKMRARLPGYAVPRYVRETPGATAKTPIP